MQLYLIRHGQSYINLPDWPGGDADTPLTDLGHQQAAALAEWLPDHLPNIDGFYTSSMQRARQTSNYLAKVYNLTPTEDDRIREIGNNRLDHSRWPEDHTPRSDEFAAYWSSERPFSPTVTREHGESMMHFKIRVGMFVEEMLARHKEEIVVAVCHGGVFDMFFDYAFNIGPWRRCELWTTNTGIAHFEHINHTRRETWRLHYQNRVEHLSANGLLTQT